MATDYGIKSIAIRDYELLPGGIAGTRIDNGRRVQFRESQIQEVAYGSENGITTAWVRPQIKVQKVGNLPSMQGWEYLELDGKWSIKFHTKREAVAAAVTALEAR